MTQKSKQVKRKSVKTIAVFGQWGFTLATNNIDEINKEVKRLERLGFSPYLENVILTFPKK